MLRGTPYHLAKACVRFRVRSVPRPFGYCNRYSGRGEDGAGHAEDYALAASLLDSYRGGRLRVTDVRVRLDLRRGVHEAELVRAQAPSRVRPGARVPITLTVQRPQGRRERVRLTVRVPCSLKPGRRTLTMRGARVDVSASLGELLFAEAPDAGPKTAEEVAALVPGIGRDDGVRASFGRDAWPVYRDPDLLITGRARVGRASRGAERGRGSRSSADLPIGVGCSIFTPRSTTSSTSEAPTCT